MGKINQQLTAVEGRRAVRIQREAELRTKEDRRLKDLAQASASASASLNNGDTSDISDLGEESSAELSDYNPECKSSDSSDTQAATTYGQNASGMSLSVSSIRRTRSKHRTQADADVKSAFNRDGPLVIHFDGELLPSIAGSPGKEDRVAIIVTGRTTEKLLAIPKVVQGTVLCSDIFRKVLASPTIVPLPRSLQKQELRHFDVIYGTWDKNSCHLLFSDLVSAEVKKRMASCLITASEHETSSERSIKYTGKEELGDKKLDYFIETRPHFFFQVLNLDKSFLNLPVEQWPQLETYQHAKVVAHSLKVVNDSAERSIALATNFNKSLTKKENEKQYLYQVVESHRKQYPDAKKATLNQ
ncbi:hypothetical protein Bpfe_017194 [Biomphalaria pfeifferi]|uniref:Uncharacterized protein n=1 Tax=Biomphalaria pfeifferi TaxID=112525 RepID=A0AAD8BET1_BIOPF|nr:hypothetical protein Bpfe_017194 [Biomphalaria pfeifferi]